MSSIIFSNKITIISYCDVNVGQKFLVLCSVKMSLFIMDYNLLLLVIVVKSGIISSPELLSDVNYRISLMSGSKEARGHRSFYLA